MNKLNEKLSQEILDTFPTDINSYLSDLSLLDNFNFHNYTYPEIYETFYKYVKILGNSFGLISPENFNNLKFYRVRLNISDTEDITLISTHSYPPPYFCKKNGRANLEGKSVFYCTNDPQTAIAECKPNCGDEGFISIWKGRATEPLRVGIFVFRDLPEYNKWSSFTKRILKNMEECLVEEAKDKIKHIRAMNTFIANKFISEEKPYYLTSMISNTLLYEKYRDDFILYPSFVQAKDKCNLAFHPNSVHKNMELEKIIFVKVVSNEDNGVKFRLGKVGYLKRNKMHWRSKTAEEIKMFLP